MLLAKTQKEELERARARASRLGSLVHPPNSSFTSDRSVYI
jgi:hypothetical protein